ncbi:hypothetical protein ACJ2_44000 [Pantoea sp. QMID2]|nr:hypothetical protein ACJ1_42990 [Pantoea sp. QMID1]GME47718.1 hypothetical protein ACJ3_43870 [Pantoea sp. QMID3]GME62539.1 hypothetical protein ACJ4_43590 [Pantoea sp. QMID4]GME63843.1 hypothetical protein ACJ2_44000 [Pantoea sp. QMID2]
MLLHPVWPFICAFPTWATVPLSCVPTQSCCKQPYFLQLLHLAAINVINTLIISSEVTECPVSPGKELAHRASGRLSCFAQSRQAVSARARSGPAGFHPDATPATGWRRCVHWPRKAVAADDPTG